MKSLLLASPMIVAASALALAGAEGNVESKSNAAAKMTAEQCDAVWMKANPNQAEKISESEASAYISDIKAVNTDGDKTIERDEFKQACDQGLIKQTADASGDAKTKAGLDDTSDRTPDEKNPTPPAQKPTADGETSDRTPDN